MLVKFLGRAALAVACLSIALPLAYNTVPSFRASVDVQRKRSFAFVMQKLSMGMGQLTRKQDLFSTIPENSTIVEIGIGTGANFKVVHTTHTHSLINPLTDTHSLSLSLSQFYPKGARVIGVEPNPFMEQYLVDEIAKHDHLSLDKLVEGSAEALPFEDASVDVVVSTLVLCSVADVPRALKEVVRVLKPNGRFYFIEHVAAEPKESPLRSLQTAIKAPWAWVGDGCEPDRTTLQLINAAGFTSVQAESFDAKVPFFLAIIRPHIAGYASK